MSPLPLTSMSSSHFIKLVFLLYASALFKNVLSVMLNNRWLSQFQFCYWLLHHVMMCCAQPQLYRGRNTSYGWKKRKSSRSRTTQRFAYINVLRQDKESHCENFQVPPEKWPLQRLPPGTGSRWLGVEKNRARLAKTDSTELKWGFFLIGWDR